MFLRNSKFYFAVVISLSLAGSVVFSGCGRAKSAAKSTAEAAELKPLEVATAKAESRDVPLFLQVTGNFAADELSDIAPQISGQVVATPVDVGSFVRQGAVIARLDDRDAKLRLQQSLAAQRQAEAALKQAEAKIGLDAGGNFNASAVPEVIAARQSYEAAEAQAKLAETNARRYENLVKTGDVAQSVADQYRTQAETARAQANAAKQQYEVALNVARPNNQGIATAQAAIARKALNDTVITAPFAGYISDRPTAVGEYVNTQSKIATLIKSDVLKLNLQLPESSMALARPGVSVIATVAAFPKAEFEGTIHVVNPALDTASRTVIAEALIKNDGNRLKPGMFASAKIYQQGGGQGLFIPRSAVLTEANIASARVYVVEGDVARVHVVQVGEQEGDLIRVLNGIAATDIVVTNNLEQLYDGARISKK
jgi:multidrug efflux pump subunit AcrA (membrane-fusion protein)